MEPALTRPSASAHSQPTLLLQAVGGDPALLRMMSEIFFRESQAKLLAIRQAVAAGDVRASGRHCHALKGTVGPLGAAALLDLLQQVEDGCAQRGTACSAQQLATIEAELAAVSAELAAFLRSH